jgi:hypothetical protein
VAEGRAKFATIQRSEDGLSIGVRLRVALDLLESLGEAGAALAPRGPKTKLRFDRIEIDEEGQSSLDGAGDQTGIAQLVWEIIAGKSATWSGTATDDDLPDDVPGAVLDVLGGFLGDKGTAGDVGEKLEEASRGFVDTHDDVRSAVASWRESHEEEEAAAPAPPAPAPAPKPVAAAPKPVEPAPKPAEPAPKAPEPPPKPVVTAPEASAAKPAEPAVAAPSPPKAAEPVAKPAAAAPPADPTPPAAKVEAKKPIHVRLPSELPGAWDDAPLSQKLDDVITEGELPPAESVAPAPAREPSERPLAEGRPGAAAAYPQVPPAPRAPSFPDADEAAAIEAKKPGRLAPPHPAAPQPPPSVQRPPQPTVPESKAARSFIETVPPTANLVAPVATAPAGLLAQQPAAAQPAPPPAPPAPPPPAPPPPAAADAATRAAPTPPRAPMKTDPLRTLPKPAVPLAELKRTEPMRPRPGGTNGSTNGAASADAQPGAEAAEDVTLPTPKTAAPTPGKPGAPPAVPRKTIPDIKATAPFRRRLPGPHDPGGDEEPLRGPLSRPLPADTAALASDGAIPLPVQTPSPSMPTAKVILEGPDRVRAQMDTQYTRRLENPTPQPVVQATVAPDFSIPAPPKKSRVALVAVVIVALLGIGLFAFLASQMKGPPEMTPAPTVTAPAPTQTTGAGAPPQATPSEPAIAPPPATTPAPVATAEPPPPATAPAAPTSRAGASHTAAPHGSGRTPPKKWQPNLPDRL